MTNDLFWSIPVAEVLQKLQSTPQGLSDAEVAQRLNIYGPNRIKAKKESGSMRLLMDQFKSPIICGGTESQLTAQR